DLEDDIVLSLPLGQDRGRGRLPLCVLLSPSQSCIRLELDALPLGELHDRNAGAYRGDVPVLGDQVARIDGPGLVMCRSVQDEQHPALLAPQRVTAVALLGEDVPFEVSLERYHPEPV